MQLAKLGILMLIMVIAQISEAVDPKEMKKDTPAAERTRTKLLKTKLSVEFKAVPLREVLKELAGQVDMVADRPIMWTYGSEVVEAAKPVTYSCKAKTLDKILDEMFKALGLGYIVVNDDSERRDGWVRVTVGDERGYEKAGIIKKTPANPDSDETTAASSLTLAKGLIADGKTERAKPILGLIVKKYGATKAAVEAKELLEKLDK